jgi:hypothetical protein
MNKTNSVRVFLCFICIHFLSLGTCAVQAGEEINSLLESKRKALEIFNQYLDVIHTRYTDPNGNFDPTLSLMPRDISNINTLNSQYFGKQPMTHESTAKAAEGTLLLGIKQLTAAIQNRNPDEDDSIQLREIHIQGENDPQQLHVATLTKIQGQVELLTNPMAKIINEDPKLKYAKFDGKYYSYKFAALRDSLKNGDIVRIGSTIDSKARLVFNNGDHIELGSNSAFRMIWALAGDTSNTPAADLLYGRIRLIVKKGGPRKKLRVTTRAAVLGVRGTDFYLDDKSDTTKVVVMRGKVHVKPISDKIPALDIPAGYTASIPRPIASPTPIQKDLTLKNFDQNELDQLGSMLDTLKNSPDASAGLTDKTILTKLQPSDLSAVQEITVSGDNRPSKQVLPGVSQSQPASIENQLEEKAYQMVLGDILNENPASITQIRKQNLRTVDQLDALTIELIKSP